MANDQYNPIYYYDCPACRSDWRLGYLQGHSDHYGYTCNLLLTEFRKSNEDYLYAVMHWFARAQSSAENGHSNPPPPPYIHR